ncbi:MAG: hypothetical protein JWM78_2529 [Verrucomicrobiaceae bacterium]|nr:hypothetical protein [Verrucomicrobiaceae bacterium]
MNEEIKEPDGPFTADQEKLVAALNEEKVAEIDAALLLNATDQWRKVAMIVGITMSDLKKRKFNIPDIFYSQRISKLVSSGQLESAGNLAYMRYSEVRIPQLKSESN